jgi:hypothetical protein
MECHLRVIRFFEAFATKCFGWVFSRSSSSPVQSTDTLKVVTAYAAALSLNPGSVKDISHLPYPKPRIKQALVTAMGLATQASMRDELRAAYLQLAQWQAPGAQSVSEQAREPVDLVSERVTEEAGRLREELQSQGL